MVEVFQEVDIDEETIQVIKSMAKKKANSLVAAIQRLARKKVNFLVLTAFPATRVIDKPQAEKAAEAHIIRLKKQIAKMNVPDEVFDTLFDIFYTKVLCEKIQELYLVACEDCLICGQCSRSNNHQKKKKVFYCLLFTPSQEQAKFFDKCGRDKNKYFIANVLKKRF